MSRSRQRRSARPRPRTPEARACIEIDVDRLASSGDAVGRDSSGRTVFVEGAAPGDRVRVRLEREKARWARGRIEEILEPGPARVEPPCPHFAACGGCTWQHVAYEAQVAAKAAILGDAMQRIGGFDVSEPPPITPSPEPYAYRGRARILVRDGRPGYRARASHRHQPISECGVLAPELEAVVRDWPRDSGQAHAAAEQEWSLCVGRDGSVSMAPRPPADESHGDAPHPGSAGGGARTVSISTDGEDVEIDAHAFGQANRLLHEPLARRVIEVLLAGVEAPVAASWRILEVHAGVGFFTLPLARRVASLVAVEADLHAVSLLRGNVARAARGHAPVDVIAGFFGQLPAEACAAPFDAVLVDPPRAGLTPAEVSRIVALQPGRIVYLSCDPATLARDARAFADAGWRLAHLEGFDLFPQTPHTEGLVRLERAHDA